MKILCPIMNHKDILELNHPNNDVEFFCGYMPRWWVEKYNNSKTFELLGNLSTPINNRNGLGANVLDFLELKKIVQLSEERNTRLFLVLNAKYYPEYVYDDLKRYVEEVIDAGIKEMIICDLGILSFMENNYPEIKVTISCLNQVTNAMAVDFYSNFENVKRIVFPRHVSVSEIKSIANKHKNMEFEFFVFSNKCLYDDGFCRGVHEFTPICKDLFYSNYFDSFGEILPDHRIDDYKEQEAKYREWTRNENLSSQKGYCTRNFACSACSLIELCKLDNIVSVKISIRGHEIEERKKQVEMARMVIETAQKGDINALKQTVCKMYGKPTLCSDGKACMMK